MSGPDSKARVTVTVDGEGEREEVDGGQQGEKFVSRLVDSRNISTSSSADEPLLEGELISLYSTDSGTGQAATSAAVTATAAPSAFAATFRNEPTEGTERSELQSAGSSSSTQKVGHLTDEMATLIEVAARLDTGQQKPQQPPSAIVESVGELRDGNLSARPELLHQRSISENSDNPDTHNQQLPPRDRQNPQQKGRFVVQPSSHPPLSEDNTMATYPSHHGVPNAPGQISQEQMTPPLAYLHPQHAVQYIPNASPNNKQPPVVSRQRSMPTGSGHTGEQFQPPPPIRHHQPGADSAVSAHYEPSTMMGSGGGAPMVSLPDANGQIVTKKKGRFNFLEQAPSSRPASPGRMPEANDATVERQQRHERSFSASAAPASGNHTPPGLSAKSFDGSGSLVITKKGRFVVTSGPVTAQSSQTIPPEHASEQMQSIIQSDIAQSHGESSGPVAVHMPQPVQLSFPSNATSSAIESHGAALPVLSGQPPMLALPTLSNPSSNRVSPVSATSQGAHVEGSAPASAHIQQVSVGEECSGPSSFTSTGLQARGTAASRPTPSRHSSSALAGQQGFGKLLYFLDQMRLEVNDADKNIKALQTDMKCLVSRVG
jgi:hypothetical protein